MWLATRTQSRSPGWGRCPFSDHCPPNPVLNDPRAQGGRWSHGKVCFSWGWGGALAHVPSPSPCGSPSSPPGSMPAHPSILSASASVSPSVRCGQQQSCHMPPYCKTLTAPARRDASETTSDLLFWLQSWSLRPTLRGHRFSVFCRKKTRLREVRCCAPGHTARARPRQSMSAKFPVHRTPPCALAEWGWGALVAGTEVFRRGKVCLHCHWGGMCPRASCLT